MLPKNWPTGLKYSNNMDYTGMGVTKVPWIKGVEIREVKETNHPAYGQMGLYATTQWQQFQVIGQYTGKIVSQDIGGKYCAAITPYSKISHNIDAEYVGNELRFINDFRNVSLEPNVQLTTTFIDKMPRVLIVVIKDINEGEEILLDYGEYYWNNLAV